MKLTLKRLAILVGLIGLAELALAQELPKGYFRNPMDHDIGLSATFAEFRANHFHGGLDMRTGGAIGKAVYAAADGYVAKVSISPWGGGKILYIKHPNGYTSVYMHLDSYAGAIGREVLKEQYARQSYSIAKLFAPDELPVKKGQLVAYSGNTGGSGGPHLHFEIRSGGLEDLHTHSRAYNPLLFDLPYNDRIDPVIRGIRIYPVGGKPFELGKENELKVSTPFYLGIYATDAAEGSTQRNGLHRIEVHVDNQMAFMYTTDAFPVDSSRMVNALIDYRHYIDTRQAYLLTRALPGAEGEWIPIRQGDGIFRFEPGGRHKIQVRAYDIKDNLAERTFTVDADEEIIRCPIFSGEAVKYNEPFNLQRPACWIQMAPHTLYADDFLDVRSVDAAPYSAPLVTIRPTVNDIPPDKAYTLSLKAKATPGIDPKKVVVALVGTKKLTAYSTSHSDGWHTAQVRDFGQFTLAVDTTSPTVAPVNFSESKPLKGTTIRIKIGDNLSGIDTYNCYLNNQWILAEYDGKTATLTIDTRSKLRDGRNELVCEATDGCGNRTRKTWKIIK
ncbi:MAG: M23 family metallopeptidase [Bacteroidales bacterium]|nr:M23 family metallopeptidase [Bacteroidales bacterium]